MEIIDKFFDDLQELYEFERGLKNERYLILKENELPALEIIIEANRGIHKKIKNEIIEKNIAPHFISSYLVDFKNMLYRINLLIDDRLKDKLIHNYGDRQFEVVSRFKALSWTAKKEIQEILNFLEQVPAPNSPKDTIEQHLQKVFDQLRQKNREMNTPLTETRGFKSNLKQDQLKSLYYWLLENKFLDNSSDETFFINSFSGEIIDEKLTKKLTWIDTPQRAKNSANIQTIFQLLKSLGIEFKKDEFIPSVQNQIKLLFNNDFGNIKSKHNDFIGTGGNQPRQTLISDYITTLLKP